MQMQKIIIIAMMTVTQQPAHRSSSDKLFDDGFDGVAVVILVFELDGEAVDGGVCDMSGV